MTPMARQAADLTEGTSLYTEAFIYNDFAIKSIT
jgi:hypothetical protein